MTVLNYNLFSITLNIANRFVTLYRVFFTYLVEKRWTDSLASFYLTL